LSNLQTANRIINIHHQTLTFNGVTTKVRPKTFSLLMVFLKHPFEVLSKQMLLDTIWDDVEVSEQVLFQTIRELRQIFMDDEVLKTHPRKGYAWIARVEECSLLQQQDKNFSTNVIQNNKEKTFPWLPLISMIFFIALTIYYTLINESVETNLSGTLVILPMKSVIKDNDHQWVYLGAMDQLISQLQSNDTLVVLSTNFILTLMEEAELKRNYETINVRRIFEVSGASIVVETELAGSTQNYELKYTLHFKHDIKRGVIFERNINDANIKLAKIISRYTGHSLIALDEGFSSEFSNELLVRALELNDENEPLSASKLLESLVQIEPSNIIAKEMLAMTYLRLERLAEANTLLTAAIELALNVNSKELPIVYHHLAVVEYIQGNFSTAKRLLAIADEYAIKKHDWLYRAYVAQLKSRIEIKQNNLSAAHVSLNNALSYHSVLQCPVGTSITLLQLKDLAEIQGHKRQAQEYFDRANQLIEDRGLTFLENLLEDN
jgi:transcriptional activator of cad operon